MMSKPIVLEQSQWEVLYNQIKQDYPLSIVLIRSRMRDKLGFTLREHREWVPKMDGGYHSVSMRLDFYDEPKRLMFLLKYGEFLEKNKDMRILV
jgi:hypothetical protein